LEFAQWMKRYYDLNNGSTKNYDPVVRRGSGIPDFGFGEKQLTNRGKMEERSQRRRSKERMRSMGPVLRQSDKKKTDLLLSPKKKSLFKNKETSQEVKGLYEYLKSMKAIIERDNMRESDKIDKISELVKNSLNLKMFDAERKERKEYREVIGNVLYIDKYANILIDQIAEEPAEGV